MLPFNDYVRHDGLGLAALVRQGELQPSELLDCALARIDAVNPGLNAVIRRRDEAAQREAAQIDKAAPFAGVPFLVKDLLATLAGEVTGSGNRLLGQLPIPHDSELVRRWRAAGVVIAGRTNTPEFGLTPYTEPRTVGPSCNPWDPGRTPGGSSGGSAAALAAGLTALELGSDIGASIRNPAHYCGVWGHKPTWGLLSMEGQQVPGTECVDTLDIAAIGPMARSAHDLALAMDVLASPLRSFGPLGWQPAAWRDAGVPPRLLRVAVLRDDRCAEVDASVQQALGELLRFLRDAGVTVTEDARPVDSREAYETYIWLLRGATGAKLDDAGYAQALQAAEAAAPQADDYGQWFWRASTQSHRQWVRQDQVRHKLRRQWEAFFHQHDLLICPVATTPAFPHLQQGWRWERMLQVNGRPQPTTDQLFWAGYPGVVGLPATAVPLGLSAQGLPIGAQIIAPALADPVGLRFAKWLEDDYRGFVAPPGCE